VARPPGDRQDCQVVELVIGLLARGEDATNSRELAYARQQVAEINEQLEVAGLPTVDEPDGTGEAPTVFEAAPDALTRLQRLAAHGWYWHQELPEPLSDGDASHDEHVRWYRESEGELWGGILGQYVARDNLRRRRFDHLVLHEANNGFYVPVAFQRVLKLQPTPGPAAPEEVQAPLVMPRTLGTSNIGSSVGLLDDVGRLRALIRRKSERTYPEETTALDAVEAAAQPSVRRGAILFLR
jgi:hypothetical protein